LTTPYVFVCVCRELKLRNYTPEDEELKNRQVPKAKPASVEDKVKDQLEAANPEPVIEEVDLANLAPRKPDWDLKRDVAKKLEKLEKRTQKAIAELIRERLKGSEEELAGAVGALEHPHTVPADGAVGVEVEGHQVFWTCDDKPFISVLTTVPPHTDSLGVSTKTKAGLVTEDDPLPF
ncbi:hypothetical protein NFI96_030184, partial [Prochilodus magdalenae]